MSTADGSRLRRAGMLLTAVALYAQAAAAQTSTLSALNRYFLPVNAQVSTYSGLIFGVVLPLGVVMLVLYLALSRAIGDTREVKALSVLIALFLIPSGGYKIVSNIFLAAFSFGGYAGAPTVQLPFLGQIPAPDPRLAVSIISFFVFAWALGSDLIGAEEFQGWEYTGAAVGAFLVWISLGGGIGAVEALSWLVFLWLAYEVFESGMGARRREGFLVGLLGLFLFFHILSNLQFLPESLQQVSSTVAGLGVVVLVAFLLITLVVLAVTIGRMTGKIPW